MQICVCVCFEFLVPFSLSPVSILVPWECSENKGSVCGVIDSEGGQKPRGSGTTTTNQLIASNTDKVVGAGGPNNDIN